MPLYAIARSMDFSDFETLGVRVGFFRYIARLLAASRVDIQSDLDGVLAKHKRVVAFYAPGSH